jgi:hypothetical protein
MLRSSLLRVAVAAFAAFSLVAGAALADELMGRVKEVDVTAKKITVTPKGGGDAVVVTITDSTEFVNAKGKTLRKFDLAKLKTGAGLTITHEKAVASKVELKGAGKKAAVPPTR